MATVTSSLKLFDAMTRPLQNITQGMNMMISTMHKMQSATDKNVNMDKTLMIAKQRIASAEIDIKNSIDQAERSQRNFNDQIRSGKNASSGLLKNILGIAAAYVGFNAVQGGMNASDNFINTQSRLKLINDGLQTSLELQNKIFESANRSRGSYSAMASSIGKLGILARDAFSDNNEIIAFTELMQKSFKIGGSSATEQQAGMYQLTQAMAAGRLQGDEFRSIMENSPLLAQAIADFTGSSIGDLRKMSAEGTITADIIKGAMFSASDEINDKFDTMPKTFGDTFNQLKNKALQSFGPVIERISGMLNSPAAAQFVTNIGIAFSVAAVAANTLLTVFSSLHSFISTYGLEITAMLIAWGVTYLPLMVTKLWAMVPPLYASATAWLAMNWPILLVVAAVGLLIFILRKFGVSTEQIVGFITGTFYMMFAKIKNQVAFLWNIIIAFAEFFANIFIDPVYAVKKLFFDLIKNVVDYFGNMINSMIGGLNWLIEKINDVSGKNFKLIGEFDTSKIDDFKPVSDKNVVDLSKYKMTQTNLKDAFDTGYSKGTDMFNKAVGSLKGFSLDGMDIGNIDKVGEVGKINDTVNISSEDLKTMRELAEMKNIQNFVSLTPSVSVQTGDINNGSDEDTIIARIKETLETEIASSTEEVFS
jgi:tape measure domain-containing protein